MHAPGRQRGVEVIEPALIVEGLRGAHVRSQGLEGSQVEIQRRPGEDRVRFKPCQAVIERRDEIADPPLDALDFS